MLFIGYSVLSHCSVFSAWLLQNQIKEAISILLFIESFNSVSFNPSSVAFISILRQSSPLRFSEFLSHSNISGSNLLTIRDLKLWIAFIHNKEMFYLWICTLKFCFIYILIEVWSIYRDHLYIMDSSRPFKDFTQKGPSCNIF